jgi:hypothetical protein
MTTITYAAALDPLLEISPPSNWIVAVIPKPGQRLANSDRQEDQLLGELLAGEREEIVATKIGFLYTRGLSHEQKTSLPNNQIIVTYDSEANQFELSSAEMKTTVETAAAASDWIDTQFGTVETFVNTYLVVNELAGDIHGLGRNGIQSLVNTFETPAGIRNASIDQLANVPYVSKDNAAALQTALETSDTEEQDEGGSLPLPDSAKQHVDSPVILDLQDGAIAGELVPSDSSEPKYTAEGVR